MKKETIDRIRKFTEDRDWDQFHTPSNLAKSIAIEASELLECFQWSDTEYDVEHVSEELADVLVYCQNMLDNMSPELMKQAVAITGGKALLEASGGITRETLRAVAESGVDIISVGALTHSVTAFDISMYIG